MNHIDKEDRRIERTQSWHPKTLERLDKLVNTRHVPRARLVEGMVLKQLPYEELKQTNE